MSLNRDLTVGKPGKVLLRFCLPLFASIIFQQLYNIADSFVAGKFIGNDALAAVGNSYEITLIFIAFAFGCNIGCSVIAAQLFGAKKFSDLKTLVYTVLISSGVLCVVLMTCGFLFGGALLIISLILLNNTIRVTIFSKRYLIHTMKLVGATKWFIMKPFLGSSITQGILAGLGASLLFGLSVYGLNEAVPELLTIAEAGKVAIILGAMIAGGIVISGLFTILALNKFINMKSNKIYLY